MKRKMIVGKRPQVPVSLKMPVEMVEDLKRVAPLRGFQGYQTLLKQYVGQGLRRDLEKFRDELEELTVSARIKEQVEKALADREFSVSEIDEVIREVFGMLDEQPEPEVKASRPAA